jgi:hypothetical protein
MPERATDDMEVMEFSIQSAVLELKGFEHKIDLLM